LVAAGALDTTAPSSRGERTCEPWPPRSLPKLEVLRLLWRNASFDITVRRVAVSKEVMKVRLHLDQVEVV
jgi:hypothetical protein